jgi:hypothetical protein
MSEWKDDNPDHERRETTRRNPRVCRSELIVEQAALVMGWGSLRPEY